jgi:hypothetical protein
MGDWSVFRTRQPNFPNSISVHRPHTLCNTSARVTHHVCRTYTNPVRCCTDFGDKKITVNAVAPGGIKTDMYHAVCREYIPNGANLSDDDVDEVSTRHPLPNRCASALTSSLSTLARGPLSTASACPSTSPASSASSRRRMASGSTARFSALTAPLACRSVQGYMD